ncbi:hypothetical protein [uncultured Cohaesibacter sp.]|uniref:hypothetical protein n=1 Tax=uncultured Cohaesibacter sp. TaxID=1002546 RepID=UPI0029C75612|nr:hypothetical protein [uncultured Cohaesibacter sp.]
MTTPVSAPRAVMEPEPVDLSRIGREFSAYRSTSVQQASRYDLPSISSAFETNMSTSSNGFSFEDIPLVGDFLSMVSSLFQSSEPGIDRSFRAETDVPPPPVIARMPEVTPAPIDLVGDGAFDLSKLINLPTEANSVSDVASASPETTVSSQSETSLDALKPSLPPVTGLANHPSNRLPEEALQMMQERYLKQFSQEG